MASALAGSATEQPGLPVTAVPLDPPPSQLLGQMFNSTPRFCALKAVVKFFHITRLIVDTLHNRPYLERRSGEKL